MKSAFLLLIKLVVSLLGMLVLAVGIFAWRMHEAPLSLDVAKRFIEEKVPQVSFEKIEIWWPALLQEPQILVQNLTLRETEVPIHAEKLRVDLDLWALLFGDLIAQRLIVEKPHISLKFPQGKTAALAGSVAASTPTQQVLAPHIRAGYEMLNAGLALIRGHVNIVEFREGNIALLGKPPQADMSLTSLAGFMHFGDDSTLLKTTGSVQVGVQTSPFDIEVGVMPDRLRVEARIEDLNIARMTTALDLSLPALSHFKHTFSVTLEGAMLFEAESLVADGDVEVVYHMPLKDGGTASVGFALKPYLKADNRTTTFSLGAKANAFALQYVQELWPIGLGEAARGWFLSNIKGGHASLAEVLLKGNLGASVDGHDAFQVSGKIQLRGTTVSYLGDMPPVENVDANATFDNTAFHIDILKGQVRDINVTGGHVGLLGLDESKPKADITVQLTGPIAQVLWVVDHKPLEYARQYNLDSAQFQGQAKLSLGLLFPLSGTLETDQVKVHVTADVKEAAFAQKIMGVETPLTKGALHLDIQNTGLLLEGACLIHNVPATLKIEDTFGQGQAVLSRYEVHFAPSYRLLTSYGLSRIESFGEGAVNLNLTYLRLQHDKDMLTVLANMTEASLDVPALGWQKSKGVEAIVQASLTLQEGMLSAISNLTLSGDAGHFQGKVNFDKGTITEAVIEDLKIGKNVLSGHLKKERDEWEAQLKGLSLNLAPFFSAAEEQTGEKTSKQALPETFVLVANIDHVLLPNQVDLMGLNASLRQEAHQMHYIMVEGKLFGKDVIKVLYQPQGAHKQLTVHLENVGALLRGLDITKTAFDGIFVATGEAPLNDPAAPLTGAIKIKNIRLKEAPVMAQLLTMASISGIGNLLSGNGIVFDDGKGSFDMRDGVLVLNNCALFNGSLGMTAEGILNFVKNTIHLQGRVIPAYMLNQLLGHIPLLGTLLSGGDPSKGVFNISYEVKGPFSKPEVSVNPLSVFAPNVFKTTFDNSSSLEKIERELNAPMESTPARPE